MRTGLDFKSPQFNPVRGKAEDWTQPRGFEIYVQSELEDLE